MDALAGRRSPGGLRGLPFNLTAWGLPYGSARTGSRALVVDTWIWQDRRSQVGNGRLSSGGLLSFVIDKSNGHRRGVDLELDLGWLDLGRVPTAI